MTTELQNSITERAKSYTKNEYKLFEAEMGWEEWMEEFCTDEECEDGAFLSEKSTNRINKFLQECFDEAHPEEDEDEE